MNSLRCMVKTLMAVFFVTLLAFSHNSYADKQANIEIETFWVVLPPNVARSTAGYGIIKNTGDEPDTLLAIRSDGGSVMLHKTDIKSGMARMLHMDNMIIEPGTELVLEPMSYHLMFTDLCPIIFTKGGAVKLSFEFKRAGIIELTVPLRPSW